MDEDRHVPAMSDDPARPDELPATPSVAGPPAPLPPIPDNSSGQRDGALPTDLPRFTWAGFLFPTLFAGFHRLWKLLALAAVLTALFVTNIVPSAVSSALTIALSIWVGVKGSSWAWRRRHWDDVAHFRRVQRRLAWGSLALIVALVGIDVAQIPRGGEYSAHGVRVAYPARWQVDPDAETVTGIDDLKNGSTWVDAIVGEGEYDVAVVFARDLGVDLEQDPPPGWEDEVAAQAESGGATLVTDPIATEVGGHPAVRLDLRGGFGGQAVHIHAVLVVVHDVVVTFKCQNAWDDRSSGAECTDMVESFAIEDPGAVGA